MECDDTEDLECNMVHCTRNVCNNSGVAINECVFPDSPNAPDQCSPNAPGQCSPNAPAQGFP